MGCDIHYAIEARDSKGRWHALYLSDLFYTAWWQNKFMPGMNKYNDDPHGLSAMRSRRYILFGTLSGVRTTNYLAHVLGVEGGILEPQPENEEYALPEDVSDIVQEQMGIEHGDMHSQGWIGAEQIAAVLFTLKTYEPRTEDEEHALLATQQFLEKARTAMRLFAGGDGTPGLVGRPICYVPENHDYDDPNAPVTTPNSHHEILEIVAALQSGKGIPDSHLRLLVCYDN